MFTNKHDPLVDSVKSVMEKNNLRRQVEEALNEELGVSSRKAVPHEHLASYDAMLEEAYKCAMEEDKDLSPKQKALAKLGTVTGHGGNSKKIDEPDLAAARKGHAHKVGLEETQLDEKAVSKAQHRFFGLVRGIQKGQAHGSAKAEKAAKEMSAKEVRKFAKTKEKGLPEKVDESNYTIRTRANRPVKEDIDSIMEEIRSNLEEKLVAVYESGDAQMFEEFVSSLTKEQIEILGLNEGLGTSVFGGLGDQAAASLANRPSRASARPAPTMTRPAARPSAPATAARPSGAPAPAPAPATGRPAPAPAPAAGRPAPAPAVTPPGSKPTGAQFGPRQSPSDMGAPPAGSPQYQGAKEAGAGNANLTAPPQSGVRDGTQSSWAQAGGKDLPVPPPSKTTSTGAAIGSVRAAQETDTGQSSPQMGAAMGNPSIARQGEKARARIQNQQQPSQSSRQETGGRLGAEIPESYHIKESLESMIRSKYLKG